MEGTVGLFALLGFVYVPLGRHTGLEHACAVLSTPAARSALADVTSSMLALRQRAADFITGREPGRPTEQGGSPTGDSPRGNRDVERAVRPVPPKLE